MLEIADCACGIDLARSADAFGSDDETSSSGWNAWTGGKEGGWYVQSATPPIGIWFYAYCGSVGAYFLFAAGNAANRQR